MQKNKTVTQSRRVAVFAFYGTFFITVILLNLLCSHVLVLKSLHSQFVPTFHKFAFYIQFPCKPSYFVIFFINFKIWFKTQTSSIFCTSSIILLFNSVSIMQPPLAYFPVLRCQYLRYISRQESHET